MAEELAEDVQSAELVHHQRARGPGRASKGHRALQPAQGDEGVGAGPRGGQCPSLAAGSTLDFQRNAQGETMTS